jgi:hypothetical protein
MMGARLLAVSSIAIVAIGAGAAFAADSAEKGFPQLPDKFIKARMHTDGVFTAGQPETITLTRMLRKVKVSVDIEPGGPECAIRRKLVSICFPLSLHPAPGAPRFRTNGRGRATLTFVMPSSFTEFRVREFTMPTVAFTNGQPIHVFAFGLHRRGHGRASKLIDSAANAPVVVEVPPAS